MHLHQYYLESPSLEWWFKIHCLEVTFTYPHADMSCTGFFTGLHLETLLLLSRNSAATLRWIGDARKGCERKALEDTQMVELNHFYCGFGELKLILLYAKANSFDLFFKEMYVKPWATAVSLQHLWVEKWQLMTLEKKDLHRSLRWTFTLDSSEATTYHLSTFHRLILQLRCSGK